MFDNQRKAGDTLNSGPILLGVMPPLTGMVEIYGQEISLAAQIACQEVNESGGILGRPLELIIEDDGSLPESAVAAAQKLVDRHRCVAIIGNLLSNSRISVAYRVAEPRKIPYLNFSFYEGSISSRYFFHFAALPNQQIDKMIPCMQKMYGSKMFFAGNNYEWPRGSIDAAKRILEISQGQVVGEEYCPIGVGLDDIERLLDNVEESGADVFVPYFAGIDQVHLLTAFTARGLKRRMAVVMGHYDEAMSSHLPPEVRAGFYSSNTYFMRVGTPENHRYLKRLKAMPGITGIWPQGNGILTNFGEGTYLCVKAFAMAANTAGSVESEALIDALETVSLTSPQGTVEMDPVTHHAKVNTYLSCCQADGTFKIIEQFGAIAPQIPERYRHMQMTGQSHFDEDIRVQARMLEQMTEAVFLVDSTDGTIVYTNPSSERMFGYGRGELMGKQISLLNAPSGKTPEESAADINRILYRRGVWRGDIWNIKKDGALFWSSVTVSTFTHALYGEVWLSVYKDITEIKRAAEDLRRMNERFVLATHAGQVGVWDWDIPQNVLMWDNSMYRLYGVQKGDFGGAYDAWARTIHPEDKAHTEGEIQAALRGEREYAPEFRIVRPDGTIRYLKADSQTFRDKDDKPLRMIGTNIDISERKRAEEELRTLNTELEDRVLERTRELQQALETAEAANRAKSVFLANMSHELRTPLNAIIGFSDILGREPGISESQQETIGIIKKSGDHLLGLINDVLDIAKIESGRIVLEPKPFDLGSMVLDVTDMLSIRAEDKGLRLLLDQSSEFPRYIVGDEAKLRQILINLLSNAIKATLQGGVTLRLGVRHNHAAHLFIEVEDTGCGIAVEDQGKLFQPFVQVGPQARQQGTGLGLAITRQFAELMGGSVSVTSSVGQGSVFRVEVAVRLVNPEEIPQASAEQGEVAGLEPGQPTWRVLVVEDQKDNQILLMRLLERAGFQVRLAGNGAGAVEQFTTWQPHFIWMDRRMPVMDGVEATGRIRALPGGEAVKIAAVTASTFKEEDAEMTMTGFDAVVHKPYRPAQLFACMERLLGARFVRAEAETMPTTHPQLSGAALDAVPDALRQELNEALLLLDSKRILEVIGEIGKSTPELAAALGERAQNYDYTGILEAIQGRRFS